MKKTDDFPYSSLKNGRDINRSVGAYSKMISYYLIPKTSNILSMSNCECCAQSKIIMAPF